MAEAPEAGKGRRTRREPQINTSAGHVFDALRAVAASPEPIGGTDVARAVGVPVSTAHRALVTLEEGGFVTRHGNGPKYHLGLRSLELVAALIDRYEIRKVAQDCLRALAEQTGETATLVIRLGWYAVCVDGHEGWQAVHRPLQVGERSILHGTPVGRLLLAGQPGDVISGYVRSAQAGPLSSVEARELRRELADIGEDDRLIASDQDAKVTTMAFPVRGPDGVVVAAIAVYGSSAQFAPAGDERLPAWRELVREAEARVAADPARFTDPFAHLPAGSLWISTPGGPDGSARPL